MVFYNLTCGSDAICEQIFQSNEIMQIFVENAKQNDHIKLKEHALEGLSNLTHVDLMQNKMII